MIETITSKTHWLPYYVVYVIINGDIILQIYTYLVCLARYLDNACIRAHIPRIIHSILALPKCSFLPSVLRRASIRFTINFNFKFRCVRSNCILVNLF